MRVTLILHERIGRWARQLWPRSREWGVRLVESRSRVDLESAVCQSACPIVVVDFRDRINLPLEDLLIARLMAPSSLILALVPSSDPAIGSTAIEAGATMSLPDSATPPEVLSLLQRWIELARERSEVDGWAWDRVPELEPWESLIAEFVCH